MQGVAVGVAVHRDRADTVLRASTKHAQGNLTTIGDQDLRNGGVMAWHRLITSRASITTAVAVHRCVGTGRGEAGEFACAAAVADAPAGLRMLDVSAGSLSNLLGGPASSGAPTTAAGRGPGPLPGSPNCSATVTGAVVPATMGAVLCQRSRRSDQGAESTPPPSAHQSSSASVASGSSSRPGFRLSRPRGIVIDVSGSHQIGLLIVGRCLFLVSASSTSTGSSLSVASTCVRPNLLEVGGQLGNHISFVVGLLALDHAKGSSL